jgi:cob(I)alamin adenosyltransferase
MGKIYTRRGDIGDTDLADGRRVRKDSARIEVLGSLDELNSSLGLAASISDTEEIKGIIEAIQLDLFAICGDLAIPAAISRIDDEMIARIERTIDEIQEELPPLKSFIIPGGKPGASALHLARSICRRAERRVVRLMREEPGTVSPDVVRYLNRLSDLLFVLARYENRGRDKEVKGEA